MTRLKERIVQLHQSKALGPQPFNLVSIDLGLKNCALAAVDLAQQRPIVKEWARLDLDFQESYSPKEWAESCQQNLIQRIQVLKPNHILIEQQSWRSSGRGFVVPSTILKLRAVEAIVFGLLIGNLRGSNRWSIESVSPKAVAEYFNFDRSTTSTSMYRSKKGQSVATVKRLLEDKGTLIISPESLKTFKKERKKDDMADALLMALAWHGWQQKALKLSF